MASGPIPAWDGGRWGDEYAKGRSGFPVDSERLLKEKNKREKNATESYKKN